ncbi:MAG: LD-carboxypeptidase [bacterium]|nr:LD-carboxypeptidase [bacterium]
MRIIRPKKLKNGDAVMVVSPSQPISSARNLNRGVKTLNGLDFEVRLSQYVNAVFGMYEAGTAEQRNADLMQAFTDKEVKGIFMSGGGFLANKVLPLLDYDLIRKNPKMIMGFSDGTTLLNAIYAKTGLVTFHGFSIEHFFKRSTPYTVDSFLRIVQNNGTHFYPRTHWRILKPGRASGRLLGGNLLSFVNLLGTSYSPDLTNSILFFEEHDDYSEDVENSLTRLINADIIGGKLVQGIIFGKFVNIGIGSNDPDTKKWKTPKGFTFYQILKRLFADYDIPILANVDFGLTSTPLTMPIGVEAIMDLTNHKERPYFKLTEPATR